MLDFMLLVIENIEMKRQAADSHNNETATRVRADRVLNVRVPSKTRDSLRDFAFRDQRSLSQAARILIERGLEKENI